LLAAGRAEQERIAEQRDEADLHAFPERHVDGEHP
jgi:hypothetical protein